MAHRPASLLTKHAWWFALAAIVFAVLPPEPASVGPGPRFLLGLFPASRSAALDSFGNVCLYVPFGLALAARGLTRRRTLTVAFVLSGTTELLQAIIPGRDPSVADVLANTMGAWLGAMLLLTSTSPAPRVWFVAVDDWTSGLLDPNRRRSGLLAFAWAALVASTFIASARLLVPAPLPPPYLVIGADVDTSVGPITIGSNTQPDGHFSGLIDEVRFFSSARSVASIQSDMMTPVAGRQGAMEDLVAEYGFDAPSGGALHDDSGHGHKATSAGTEWTSAGRFGGAMSFDGSGEVLVAPSVIARLHDRWTVEAWIRPMGEPEPESTVVAGPARSFYLFASSEHGRFVPAAGAYFGSAIEQVQPDARIAADAWTHVALSYDGEALRFFINGRLAQALVRWSPHRVIAASINGEALVPGLLRDAPVIHNALQHGVVFRGTVVCGALSDVFAPMFVLKGLWNTDMFTIAAERSDLLVIDATWPRRLRLRSPPARVSDALSECAPGRQLPLEISGPLQAPRVRVGERFFQGTTPGIASAWTFVLHSELLPAFVNRGLSLLWLAALVIPLGFWARNDVWTFAGAALVVTGAWVVPPWFETRTDSAQSIAMVVGVSAGILLRARRERHDAVTSRAAKARSESS